MLTFNVIDLETANADRASICQIGVVHVQDGKIIGQWQTLINPEDWFDEFYVGIHGIDEDSVIASPTLPDVYDELHGRLRDSYLVSHGSFDRTALGLLTFACSIGCNEGIFNPNPYQSSGGQTHGAKNPQRLAMGARGVPAKPFCGLPAPGRHGATCPMSSGCGTRSSNKGTFEHVFKVLSADADFEYVLIDGTIVRLHQHGARAEGGPRTRLSDARGVAPARRSA